MTVRELAALAGTSTATISRYLADRNGVAEATRQRIDTVVSTADPSELPRVRRRRTVIAVLLPHLRLEFYQCALLRLMEEAQLLGFQLVILPALSKEDNGWAEMLEGLSPSGVIGMESAVDERVAAWLEKHPGVRMALLAEETLTDKICMVHINDLAAAYEGTKYLLGLGHKHICFFSNQPSTTSLSTSFQRLTGSRKAMLEAGLPFEENVRYGELTYARGYALGEELAKDRGEYTALFAYSDEMAVGAIMALEDHGVRVPEDISVLGIDDLPIGSRIRPQLTTIHQPLGKMARSTLAFFEKGRLDGRGVIVPHRIVERGTCARLEE